MWNSSEKQDEFKESEGHVGDDDDDVPQLSAETFMALQQFYQEEEDRERHRKIDDCFKEDWQLSQFWYDEATSLSLARECVRLAGNGGSIACVATPSVFKAIRTHLRDAQCDVRLLEFDRRFSIFGEDYIFYDYRQPLEVGQLKGRVMDVVLADPPYLSEECLSKTADTIRALGAKHIILCTGLIMEGLAATLLDLKLCNFRPRHSKNLANEFRCYANYPLDDCMATP